MSGAAAQSRVLVGVLGVVANGYHWRSDAATHNYVDAEHLGQRFGSTMSLTYKTDLGNIFEEGDYLSAESWCFGHHPDGLPSWEVNFPGSFDRGCEIGLGYSLPPGF